MQEQELLTYRRQVGFGFRKVRCLIRYRGENVAYRCAKIVWTKMKLNRAYRNPCDLWNWSTPGNAPVELSVACVRRVSIARTLATRPPIVLYDSQRRGSIRLRRKPYIS